MKKKIGKLIVGLLIFLFISAICIQYKILNDLYPKPKEIIYDSNEAVELENDIWMQVTSVDLKDDSYVKNMQSYSAEFEEYDEKLYMVTIKLENHGEIPREIDMTKLRVVSGAWSNAIRYPTFLELNPEGTLYPKITPDESCEFILPYYMFEGQFKHISWKHVEERSYSFVYQLYPETKSIKLN